MASPIHHEPESQQDGQPEMKTARDTESKGIGNEPDKGAEELARLHKELLRTADKSPRKVLDVVARIESQYPDATFAPRDENGNTPLHLLVAFVKIPDETLTGLLDRMNPTEINALSSTSSAALHTVSKNNQPSACEILLNKGADFDVRDGPTNSTPLHLACWKGREDTVRVLCKHAIKHGLDLNPTDKGGYTPLYDASRGGHVSAVKLLFEFGKDKIQIDTAANQGRTPLIAAARNGHADVVETLIKLGAELNMKDSDGSTALIYAAGGGQEAIVSLLVKAGADLNAKRSDGSTALIRSAIGGREAIVSILVKAGADINAKRSDGATALLRSALNGREAVVDLLIKAGAELNTQDSDGDTALTCASMKAHEGIVSLLLEADAEINTQNSERETALMRAVMKDDDACINLLLRAGAGVDIPNLRGQTPLRYAARRGFDTAVRLLVVAGADLDLPCKENMPPLAVAAAHGHEGAVRLLLGAGAEVEALSTTGWSALKRAARYGYKGAVKALVGGGADVNKRDSEGWGPLAIASYRGHTDIVRILLDAGANASQVDDEGVTPLLRASEQGYLEIVDLLVEHPGVMLDAADKRGRTALHMASMTELDRDKDPQPGMSTPGKHLDCIKRLLDAGANVRLRTMQGETVLHVAAKGGGTECLGFFLETAAAADLNAQNSNEETVLDICARRRDRESVKILVRWCAQFSKPITDSALLSWAAEHEDSHGVVRMKLMQDSRAEGADSSAIQEDWSVLELAAHLGDCVMVQKLLASLSAADQRLKMIGDAKKIVETQALSESRHFGAGVPAATRTKNLGRDGTDIGNGTSGHAIAARAPHGRKGDGKVAEDVFARYYAIQTLLDIAEVTKTTNLKRELTLPTRTADTYFMPHATIFDFYTSGTTSTVVRHKARVEDVIYTQGPEKIMAELREKKAHARKILESLDWSKDEESRRLKETTLEEFTIPSPRPKFRWIHLPANHMQWMEDLTTRVHFDRSETGRKSHKDWHKEEFNNVLSFLGGSWAEFPDASSSSRVMKPRCVALSNYGKTRGSTKLAATKKAAGTRAADTGGKATNAAKTESGTIPPTLEACDPTALYMPYLVFADQKSPMPKSREPFRQSKYVIHGSQTLDDYYYQFGSDGSYGQEDIDKRNKDQVVSKWLHGDDENLKSRRSWVLLRVDQLWLWVVTPDTIVTSSTHRLDSRDDIVPQAVFEHLQRSQPETTLDLARLIVTVCIRFYDQVREPRPAEAPQVGKTMPQGGKEPKPADAPLEAGNESKPVQTMPEKDEQPKPDRTMPQGSDEPKAVEVIPRKGNDHGKHDGHDGHRKDPAPEWKGGSTIHGIFSSSINQAALEEVKLFETFTTLAANGDDDTAAPPSTHKNTVTVPAMLLCKVKDLRDELNILKAVLSQQQKVEKELLKVVEKDTSQADGGSTAKPIFDGINEMDKYVGRLYEAVQATLALEQNKIAIGISTQSVEQGHEAARQGKQIMAFTITTIVFLPLSFFVALFAVNVTSFPHNEEGNVALPPSTVFPVLFVSLVITFLVIGFVRREQVKNHAALRKSIQMASKVLNNRATMADFQREAKKKVKVLRDSLARRRTREEHPEEGRGDTIPQ